jgi:hypothetical protein
MNIMVDHGDDDDVEVAARDRVGHAAVDAQDSLLCAPHFCRAAICAGFATFSLSDPSLANRPARQVMGRFEH